MIHHILIFHGGLEKTKLVWFLCHDVSLQYASPLPNSIPPLKEEVRLAYMFGSCFQKCDLLLKRHCKSIQHLFQNQNRPSVILEANKENGHWLPKEKAVSFRNGYEMYTFSIKFSFTDLT